jgi:ABC-type lipoprotein release transport system permease subunit
VVGVAADAKYTSATEKPRPMAWTPVGGGSGTLQVEVRGVSDAQTLLPVLRSAMQRIDPTLPLEQPMTQAEQWQESYSDQSLMGRLAMFFGLLAAVMVATGLYGTLAYKVGQRTPEIGVRMALGASRGRVVGMVLGESLALALIGLGVGLPLAWAGGRTIGGLLFGVTPNSVGTLSLAAAGLLLVALCAALAPAVRAAGVDPLIALRSD